MECQENVLYYQYGITAENMLMEFILEKTRSTDTNPIINLTDHTHPHVEVFCCMEDRLDVMMPEGVCSLHPNDVLIIPPHILHHCLQPLDQRKWGHLGFTCSYCQSLGKCHDLYSLFLPYLTGTEIFVIEDTREIISNIIEINSNYNNDQRFLTGLQFMWRLAEYSSKKKWTWLLKKEEIKDSNLVRLNKLDQIINTEFMVTRTAAEIAEIMHLSTRQLSRIVEKRYGTTLHKVILSKRLETAAKLLRYSDFSLVEISNYLAFLSKNRTLVFLSSESGYTERSI